MHMNTPPVTERAFKRRIDRRVLAGKPIRRKDILRALDILRRIEREWERDEEWRESFA